jgi:hydroxymethylpyrimidine pyrophosphatase-like HAD family hydrolase
MPIIAIDFDGTLVENKFPEIGEVKVDKNKVPIIDKVLRLQEEGWQTILWTCREMEALDNAVAWCKNFRNYYLDDRAVNEEDF